MDPVKSLKNQYLGINAHLNSYWQANGDWSEFHTSYIVHNTPADQARITNRMLAVLEAAQKGIDLESGPFPTQSLALEEALARIETLQA